MKLNKHPKANLHTSSLHLLFIAKNIAHQFLRTGSKSYTSDWLLSQTVRPFSDCTRGHKVNCFCSQPHEHYLLKATDEGNHLRQISETGLDI